jgi:hypothetical protein
MATASVSEVCKMVAHAGVSGRALIQLSPVDPTGIEGLKP